MESKTSAFATPTLVVRDNRGLPVRKLAYNRQFAADNLDERIERTVYNALGQVESRIDARFFSGGGAPNFEYLSSLSGHILRNDSLDSGTGWTLPDVEGRPIWSRDARGNDKNWTRDTLGRPLTVMETADVQSSGDRTVVRHVEVAPSATTSDVWIYGEAEPDAQAHNLRGRCVRRYDCAGRLMREGFSLTGRPLAETRQLLSDADADADWAGHDETSWVGALDVTQYRTTWMHDAMGTWVARTDAKGNSQQRAFDVAGRLAGSSLALAGGQVQSVLSAVDYTAAGRVLSETAGNGAVSKCTYEPETQRLVRLNVTRPAQNGRATVVQDLVYTYDPVGNVLIAADQAQATSYSRNQKINATRTYTYDALYQLVAATGRETYNRGRQGHSLPPSIKLPSDDSSYTNYTRAYAYDRGGNLATVQHRSAAADYTQSIAVSDRSNRAMQQNDSGAPASGDIDDGDWFDAAGNPLSLSADRQPSLSWNSRNRLQRVTLVKRSGPDDDREVYQYGASGMRVRKRMCLDTGSVTRMVDAIYLPGLTLRITSSNDGQAVKVVESLQDIDSAAGSLRVRALHWETGGPADFANDQTRYGMSDMVGSIGLELDGNADLINREEYYPYGGTAVWMARSQIEADTKYVRYSSKERDATGLYYYGYRYYQPWIGRWLNCDPVGAIDGLNLYRMVRNNPVTLADRNGLVSEEDPAKFGYIEPKQGSSRTYGYAQLKEDSEAGYGYAKLKEGSGAGYGYAKLKEGSGAGYGYAELKEGSGAGYGYANLKEGSGAGHGYAELQQGSGPGYVNPKASPSEGHAKSDSPPALVKVPTFQNWRWAEKGKVARSSAPSYKILAHNSDTTQSMTAESIQALKDQNITGVVSLNHYQLPPQQIEAMQKEGIQYLWLPVKDWGVPSVHDLITGAEFIESNPGASLVYCGYGMGRTGTQVSAWEIYSGRKTAQEALDTTTAETSDQKDALRFIPERWPFQ